MNDGVTMDQYRTTTYTEMYSYHPAGGVTGKSVGVSRNAYLPAGLTTLAGSLNVAYSYDAAGRLASTTAPQSGGAAGLAGVNTTYNLQYDSMSRASGLTDVEVIGGENVYTYQPGNFVTTWVQNVQYDYASRMTSLQYQTAYGWDTTTGNQWSAYTTETMSYNANGQLASVGWSTPATAYTAAGFGGGLTYGYSATQNNGQITQMTDAISGETIAYQYDALKRLVSAASTPASGSTVAAWTQTYQYDGFGNLTAKVLNGVTTSIPVNSATNQLTSSYDLNGNMLTGAGATITYDGANRMTSATEVSGGTEYYGYGPDNKRIYRRSATGVEEWTLWGARGEKLGTYSGSYSGGEWMLTQTKRYVWFAGKLIWEGAPVPVAQPSSGVVTSSGWVVYPDMAMVTGGSAYQDRVGTNRALGARYYPYGEEIGGVNATANDREKFATYNRDGFTALDHADQRYYASGYGRFNTADPMASSADPKMPQSWNRYSYVLGDPANGSDPRGMDLPVLCDPFSPYCVGGGLDPCSQIGNGLFGGVFNCGMPVAPYQPPTSPVPPPTCGQVLGLQPSGTGAFSATGLSAADLLGITSFFEDESAVPLGSSPSTTILSIWTAIDWTFENRASLSPSQARLFYGAGNVPATFQGVVTGTSQSQGSQVWNAGSGTLKNNFTTQLNSILSGSSNTSLCNGLDDSLAVGIGVVSGYLSNPVPGALQFASGGVVPGHGPGVIENPVATFGTFTFFQPIYPTR